MQKSPSITNIAKALILFSQKIEVVKKTETNPFFHSKYAPLPDIIAAIQMPLSESGLAYSQFPDQNCLTTILIHAESGEYLEASYPLNPSKNDPQSFGSAITYARRYALGAILGLSIDEDDDANKATFGNNKLPQNTPQPQKKWLNEGTPSFDNALKGMREGRTMEDIKKFYLLSNDIELKLQELVNQSA